MIGFPPTAISNGIGFGGSARIAAGSEANRRSAGREKATEPLGDKLHPQLCDASETLEPTARAQQGQTEPLQQLLTDLAGCEKERDAGTHKVAIQRRQLITVSSLRAIRFNPQPCTRRSTGPCHEARPYACAHSRGWCPPPARSRLLPHCRLRSSKPFRPTCNTDKRLP